MSDVKPEESVKPVEAKLVEPEATPAVTDTVPTAPVVVAEETPKPEEVVEDKKEEKPEPKEITQGALQKSHGGLLSFFKQKRFFYFQEEAVSESDLRTYVHNIHKFTSSCAYALQTGKGLWFYSKDVGLKHPHGIIKLSDVIDVTKSGSNKFVLKLSTGDLHFEAPAAERDSWVFTLGTKISEAKTTAEGVHESEAYKAALEKLSKPAAGKPAVAKEETTEEAAKPVTEEAKTDAVVPETAVTSDEEATEHKTDMKRSQSKKNRRISGFNVPFLGKKERVEDKKEEKKEEAAAVEEPPKPDATEKPAAPAPGVEAAGTEPVAETKPTEEEEAKHEETRPKPEETRPEPKKHRQSFFSRFGGPKKEETATEKGKEVEAVTPAAEPETTDKVAEAAPIIDIPGPVVEPLKEVAPVAATEETAVESPKDAVATSPKEKRKPSFFGFGGKEKKTEDIKSDSEDAEPVATKPSTSPVPKNFLEGLKRKVSKAGKTEKEPKEVAAPAAVAEEETTKEVLPETVEPVKTETEAKPEETPAEVAPAVSDVAAAKPVQAAA